MSNDPNKLTTGDAAIGGCGCLTVLIINLIWFAALGIGLVVLWGFFFG